MREPCETPLDLSLAHSEVVEELAKRALIDSDSSSLMAYAASLIVRCLKVECCGVFEAGDTGSALKLTAGAGWREDTVCQATLPNGAGSLVDWALRFCEPLVSDDVRADERFERPALLAGHHLVSSIVVRFAGELETPGLLGAFSTKSRRFEEKEVAFVRAVAHVIEQGSRFLQSTHSRVVKRAVLLAITPQMPAVVWTTNRDLQIEHALGANLAQLGLYEQLVGKTVFELFGTSYFNYPPVAVHVAALRGRAGTFQYPMGEVLMDFRVEPLYKEQSITGCVCTAVEISKTREAEKQLRLLNAAVESAANAIVITNRDGRVIWANSAFTELTGYPVREVLGRKLRVLRSGAHGKAFYERLWNTVLSGRVWQGEMVNRRKDGRHYTELQTITPVFDGKGRVAHFISIKQDITQRQQLEAQLRQSQRMEAVGRLAGGIAHDFNNLLTAIIGYSDLLLGDLHAGDPTRPDLAAIRQAAERASALTRQLLAFSRKQVLRAKVLDLNGSIANLEGMLQRVIGEDVELRTALEPSLRRALADPGQIEQAITNLVVNARDAMPQGGKVTIETKNVELPVEYTQRDPAIKPGPHIVVSVSDTGTGIDKKLLPHIFEPFFTTKESGKGTGLGLSTVYGIVKQSGGYIWAYSENGLGTTFKIYLPSVDAPADPMEQGRSDTPRRGSETILLVEDEDEVRRLVVSVLRTNGYDVLEARNGAEGLMVSQDREGPIHLMLTDVVMPLIGGRELAERQALLRPEMRVLYMSGYPDEAIARRGILPSGMALLEKPFTPSGLLHKVREVLDAPAP